jgi:hypothetical protein
MTTLKGRWVSYFLMSRVGFSAILVVTWDMHFATSIPSEFQVREYQSLHPATRECSLRLVMSHIVSWSNPSSSINASGSPQLSAGAPDQRPCFLSLNIFCPSSLAAMIRLGSFAVILAALSRKMSVAIGPNAVLPIVNQNVSPDGYERS